MGTKLSIKRKLTRMFANILSIFAVLAIALPATTVASAAPASPFLGQWQAIDVDGSEMNLSIAGRPSGPFQITWTDNYIAFCNGEAGIVRGNGWLDENDPNILHADLILECFATKTSLNLDVTWLYHALTNTLSVKYSFGQVTIWHRPGRPQAPPPVLNLRVNYGHDWVESFYEGGHMAWVTVTDNDGNVKATTELFTEPKDYWGGETGFQSLDSIWFDAEGNQMDNPPDIQPNDWVYGWVDNGASAQAQIGDISGTIDLTADSITGTIHAPWFSDRVQVECLDWGSGGETPFNNKDGGSILANGSDPYFCSWAGEWDIQRGQTIGVGYSDPDGNWVSNAFFITNPTFVAYIPNAIEGYDWPMGDEINLAINDVEYPATAFSEQRPDFPEGMTRVLFEVWQNDVSLKAGDHIVMTDGTAGITKDVTVTDLAVTDFNLGEGTVAGTYDPTYDLWVWLYSQDGFVPATNPNNGTWVATFAELQPGVWGSAAQHDADGDGTSIDFQVPATIFVTSTEDVLADDGVCTLREAIISANTNQPSGEMTGECPAGLESATDTIILAANTSYSLTIDSTCEDDPTCGDLDIWDNSAATDLIIRVEGGGTATISQDAAVDDRVLTVMATVKLEGLTLTGGSNVGSGGGVFNIGTISMLNCTVSDNQVGWSGGGIFNRSDGTLMVDSSIITNNRSNVFAGGIMNEGMLTVNNSEIRMNSTPDKGGGFTNEGTLIVNNSVLSGNSANQGGALYNTGTATIQNGTVVGGTDAEDANTANGGGGLFSLGTLTVNDSIVSSNHANYGGGLFNWIGGMLAVNNTTVSNNLANEGGGLHNKENSTTVIQNSVFSGNYAEWSAGGIDNWGTITITGSVLRDNHTPGETGDAIASGAFDNSAASITGSCIVGNGDTAVFASLPIVIDATGNWWGDASGPTYWNNPGGTGDSVSDYVDFSNWLVIPPDICAP